MAACFGLNNQSTIYISDPSLNVQSSFLRWRCPQWVLFSDSAAPSAVHSDEVQERGRGHADRQDLQAQHALHHQEVEPCQ